jgi:hypothetical protein
MNQSYKRLKHERLRDFHAASARHHNSQAFLIESEQLHKKMPIFKSLLQFSRKMANRHRKIAETLHAGLSTTQRD